MKRNLEQVPMGSLISREEILFQCKYSQVEDKLLELRAAVDKAIAAFKKICKCVESDEVCEACLALKELK